MELCDDFLAVQLGDAVLVSWPLAAPRFVACYGAPVAF